VVGKDGNIYPTIMKRTYSILLNFSLLLAFVFASSGCAKEETDYVLDLIVTTDDGDVRVSNAFVRVYAPVSNSFIDYYSFTNEVGELEYTFDNKVVLEIKSTKGSFKGCTFVEVEQGINTVYLDLKPFGVENGCASGN
jgi:hypothetical protein